MMGCIVNGPGEMADADFGCGLASQPACYHHNLLPLTCVFNRLEPRPVLCACRYVGGAPGKIDLYVGKEVVRRSAH